VTRGDAFDLVIPSIRGYGFSSRPGETGWDSPRIGGAWAGLMRPLGFTRRVARHPVRRDVVEDAVLAEVPERLARQKRSGIFS
jgi:hypothetical protein